MLAPIFEVLDEWIEEENREARKSGFRVIPRCFFKVVGQTALIEAKLDLEFAATVDIDALTDANHEVLARFNELLKAEGLEFDLLSNEIWMPNETSYIDFFNGKWVTASRAEPEYIMLSKAVKAPLKNVILLRSYLASRPPNSFFKLCETYKVDLAALVGGKSEY